MKVGDLVKIQSWCKNKHRMAIVVRTEDWERAGVWIRYLDDKPMPDFQDGYAMRDNLILVSES